MEVGQSPLCAFRGSGDPARVQADLLVARRPSPCPLPQKGGGLCHTPPGRSLPALGASGVRVAPSRSQEGRRGLAPAC